MAETHYRLSATAGPNYKDQTPLSVNTERAERFSSPQCTVDIKLRIQNYHGLPEGSPTTSPYFAKSHAHDLYSLDFTFTPKEDSNGHDLVLGNDFDHPIRDKLPPGFQQAFNIVKWFIDPGMYADVHANEPYLYGPMLSSINTFRIGSKDDKDQEKVEEVRANAEADIVEEGADGDGAEVRSSAGIPEDAAGRKKYFLNEEHLNSFTFEKNRQYSCDFFNPYLDFNEFALRLPKFGVIPGITIPIIKYWDGQPLRYVLKNRKTDETLFVVIFTLTPKDGKEEVTPIAAKSEVAPTTSEDDVD